MNNDTDAADDGQNTNSGDEHVSGKWLGRARGLKVREPGGLDHPVLEIHGDENMAAVEMPPEFADGLTEAAAELEMAREPMTDGGEERDPAALADAGKVDEALEAAYWNGVSDGKEKAKTPEDGGFTSDQLNAFADVMMDHGVPMARVEGVMADLTGGEQPDGSEYVRPGTRAELDVSGELMNLARHLYAESQDLGDHVRDSERGDGSELAAAIYQARADALMDAARYIRRTARWMDGEVDKPAELEHGAALSGEDGTEGVPWRGSEPRTADGGDDGDA